MLKDQDTRGHTTVFLMGVADGSAVRIGLLCQPNHERKERSETFENEIIQYVNYTDILPMFFL